MKPSQCHVIITRSLCSMLPARSRLRLLQFHSIAGSRTAAIASPLTDRTLVLAITPTQAISHRLSFIRGQYRCELLSYPRPLRVYSAIGASCKNFPSEIWKFATLFVSINLIFWIIYQSVFLEVLGNLKKTLSSDICLNLVEI